MNNKEKGKSSKLSRKLYDLKLKLHKKFQKNSLSKGGKRGSRRKADLFFCLTMIAYPVVQFIVFYVFVNINSFLLAFKRYDPATNVFVYNGLDNLKNAFYMIFHEKVVKTAFMNSVWVYALLQFVTTVISLFVTFFIFKKFPLAKFFKIILFLPSIISSIVIVLVFSYFADIAVPEIMQKIFSVKVKGLLLNPKTAFQTILFYNIWYGLGGGMLLYLGAMNSIDGSVLESAQLEGVNSLQEFIYIVFPLIYPTFLTFMVTGLAGIFTNQINLYTFYGGTADYDYYTVGYYLYVGTLKGETNYPMMSMFGILLTFIVVPLTFFGKWILEKIGPSEV